MNWRIFLTSPGDISSFVLLEVADDSQPVLAAVLRLVGASGVKAQFADSFWLSPKHRHCRPSKNRRRNGEAQQAAVDTDFVLARSEYGQTKGRTFCGGAMTILQ